MSVHTDHSAWHVAPVDPAALAMAHRPLPGRRYDQALAARPTHRWWRPLASLALLVAFVGTLFMAVGVVLAVLLLSQTSLTGATEAIDAAALGSDPWFMLGLNLVLAALIPIVLLANRIAHGPGAAGMTHSVTGRFRFDWLARIVAVVLPLWLAYLAVAFLVEPFPVGADYPASTTIVLMLTVVLVTTPLQAAGEEYLFRGWILQNVGGWVRHPIASVVLGTALSAALFALAHGSMDPAILTSLAGMAVTACWLTWRTGGLEAAVAIHAVNNVALLVSLTALGVNQSDAMISGDSTGSWLGTALTLAVNLVAALVIDRMAARHGVRTGTA